ncbi:hypothetical protein Godav_017903 [Gossypium davidsonii]|uniref:Uncharacterized protein n=2 Tax=Gossypium TaxID=3633 RepID=A0A7J8QUX5_GOSDV|nr:hypothetical protein [Gossypium davidsonii]MBA0640232.1 hypothetical protein [Gossypium klotzschianum]
MTFNTPLKRGLSICSRSPRMFMGS